MGDGGGLWVVLAVGLGSVTLLGDSVNSYFLLFGEFSKQIFFFSIDFLGLAKTGPIWLPPPKKPAFPGPVPQVCTLQGGIFNNNNVCGGVIVKI